MYGNQLIIYWGYIYIYEIWIMFVFEVSQDMSSHNSVMCNMGYLFQFVVLAAANTVLLSLKSTSVGNLPVIKSCQ